MPKLLTALRGFYKVITVLVAVVIFFVSYNRFLIDHSLEVLRFSLDEVSKAKTVKEAEGLDMILDYALLNEVANRKIDSSNVAGLEFAKSVIPKAKASRQLEDVEFALKGLIEKKTQERGVILNSLDKVASRAIAGLGYLRYMPSMMKGKLIRGQEADMLLLEKALSLEKQWKLDEAKKLYEDFINKYPKYKDIAFVKLHLGYTFQKLGDRISSKAIFKDLIGKYYGTKEGKIAQQLFDKEKECAGLLDDRENLLKKISSLISKEELQDAYYSLGVISMKMLDFDKAEEAFRKVVEIDPSTYLATKAKFNVGWNYKFQDRLDESKATFEEIVKESPQSTLASDSQYQIADTYYKAGKYEEAATQYKEVAEKSEAKEMASIAQFQAGTTYLYDLDNAKAAKEAFDKVREKFKATRLSEYTKKKIDRVGQGYRNYGFKLIRNGSYDEALSEFMKAAEINPDDGMVFSGLGLVYTFLYKYEDAVKNAEKGVEMEPDNAFVYANLGQVYTKAGEYQKAIDAYRQAVVIKPKYIQAMYNLAHLYNIKEMYDDAIKECKKVLDLDGNYFPAHGNMGYAYWYKGDLDNAEKAYRKALKINNNYLEGHYNLALIYKQKKDYKSAKSEFDEVIYRAPDSREGKRAMDHLKELRNMK